MRIILATEECKSAPVLIYFDSETVWVQYHKDQKYINIVKKLNYRWSGSHWFKRTKLGKQRASELGNKLILKGYTVEVDESIVDMTVNATYEPECFKWIKLRVEGKYKNWLLLEWQGKDDMLYTRSKSLPGSRWDSGVVVRVEYYKEIEDFAKLYNFKFSDAAASAIEEHKRNLENIKIVKPVVHSNKTDGLKNILNSSREILDDLRDD